MSPHLLLLDEWKGGFTVEHVVDAPLIFAAYTAVTAGQVGNCYTEFVPSYAMMATVLEELVATPPAARDDNWLQGRLRGRFHCGL